jgi:hypothetical protein
MTGIPDSPESNAITRMHNRVAGTFYACILARQFHRLALRGIENTGVIPKHSTESQLRNGNSANSKRIGQVIQTTRSPRK